MDFNGESNRKKWKLERNWFTELGLFCGSFISSCKLTQIDSVKRDMQFSVRQQLQQMEILKRVKRLGLCG